MLAKLSTCSICCVSYSTDSTVNAGHPPVDACSCLQRVDTFDQGRFPSVPLDKSKSVMVQVIMEIPLANRLKARAKLERRSTSSQVASIIEADMDAWQAEKGISTEDLLQGLNG